MKKPKRRNYKVPKGWHKWDLKTRAGNKKCSKCGVIKVKTRWFWYPPVTPAPKVYVNHYKRVNKVFYVQDQRNRLTPKCEGVHVVRRRDSAS
jgi:hypothetical protein